MSKCNHDRYRDESRFMTAQRALRKMKEGVVCWRSTVIKKCQDCGENIEFALVVMIKTPEEYLKEIEKW